MINDKICVCVSDENLMCRFDPALQKEAAEKAGFQPMIMKGKQLNGYCYVSPDGCAAQKDFSYWVELCLAYNGNAKSSKTKKRAK